MQPNRRSDHSPVGAHGLACTWMMEDLPMKNSIATAVVVCLVLIPNMLIPPAGFPQAGNGRITGTVTDATGAVLPGATMEVMNTDTRVVFSSISPETGSYSAPD